MKFGSQLIDEIKTRIKVSDIVSKKVKLSPRGREFVGLSPFSNEKTPSFTVSDEKGFYHCFSSGEHGSVFDFVMKTENLSFVEAVKKLASYAGISVEDKVYKKEDIIIQKRIKNLKDILTIANNWFHNNLKRELKTNKFLQEIFKKRNFNENIINTFLLEQNDPEAFEIERYKLTWPWDNVTGYRGFGFDKTWDIFGNLTYDITDRLRINLSYWQVDNHRKSFNSCFKEFR